MSDVSCYTVISADVNLLTWCISNARQRANVAHDFLVIGWNETQEIRDACELLGARCVSLSLPKMKDGLHPEQRTKWFIRNLYSCFNAGYMHAETKWVARMGSDQYFSQGWLANLMACAERHGERAVYHCTTVESPLAKHSRHEMRDWGTSPAEFDERGRQRFDVWANDLAHRYVSCPTVLGSRCDLWYNHPTRGRQRRADGVTWLQTKALWDEFGPMQKQVIDGVAPDVGYMDRLYDAGVPGYLCLTSSAYHLVRGESREVQQ